MANTIRIIRAKHRGVCCGVATALFIAEKALQTYHDRPVYMIGDLIHNRFATKDLQNKGLILLSARATDINGKSNLLKAVPNKSVVILSAHGSSPALYKIAIQKNLKVIDTACFFVMKTHRLVLKAIKEGKHVLFIGKKFHDETTSILALGGKQIYLIETRNCIDNFYKKYKKNLAIINNLVLTNQTTLSIFDFAGLLRYALKLMPKIIHYDEICNATTLRQQEIGRHIEKNIDLAVIIGDSTSNNAIKLVEICKNKLTRNSILISSTNDVSLNLFQNVHNVFITASASTPFKLIFDVENKINDFVVNKK